MTEDERVAKWGYDPSGAAHSCQVYPWVLGPTFGIPAVYRLLTHPSPVIRQAAIMQCIYTSIWFVFLTLSILWLQEDVASVFWQAMVPYTIFSLANMVFLSPLSTCPEHELDDIIARERRLGLS